MEDFIILEYRKRNIDDLKQIFNHNVVNVKILSKEN